MLKLIVHGEESYDEVKNEFIVTESFELELEHSLVSLSKWESIFKKPFLGKDNKTADETIAYIMCMMLDDTVDTKIVDKLSQQHINIIRNYIEETQSATTINNNNSGGPSRQIITSELIYAWMVNYRIPFECQHWHLSRLLMLINVIHIQNQPQKKMSKKEILNRNRALNEQRRKAMGTTG